MALLLGWDMGDIVLCTQLTVGWQLEENVQGSGQQIAKIAV